jgi:ribokinase
MTVPKIIVLGSVNVDLVIRSARLPVAGETVTGGEFYRAGGGKGANQAVAASRMSDSPVAFIAAVGNDPFGRDAIKSFRKENIATPQIHMLDDQATGVALIMVDESGQNQISVSSGANAMLTPEIVDNIDEELFQNAKVFLANLESPIETVVAGLRRAKQAGLTTILNPAPACESIRDPEILSLVDILTPNESEATFLSGWDELDDLEDLCILVEQLQQKGAKTVVVTRGEQGCFLKDGARDPNLVSAYVVDAIDATAAGDCFNGTLAAKVAQGDSILDAARFSMAAAALSVTKLGAVPSLPTRKEVDSFLAASPDRSSMLS